MTFTVTNLSQCSGGNHVTITADVNGRTVTRQFTRAELVNELDDMSAEELIIGRLRSAVKESGATTPLQIRNAIVNHEFKV